mgnify:CR=1 FL=1
MSVLERNRRAENRHDRRGRNGRPRVSRPRRRRRPARARLARGVARVGVAAWRRGLVAAARATRWRAVKFSGVRGKGPLALLLLPLKLLLAFWQSARAILAQRPDVVLGMGGYMSFPGGHDGGAPRQAARHPRAELGRRARQPGARRRRRPGAVRVSRRARSAPTHTGNPVRAEIAAIAAAGQRATRALGPLRLLVVGGSLGRQGLERRRSRGARALAAGERPHRHAPVGRAARRCAAKRPTRRRACRRARCAFIDDMAAALRRGATSSICRAGATTVAELAAAGVPSILVPFPHAVDDHQTAQRAFSRRRGRRGPRCRRASSRPSGLAALIAGFDRKRLLEMARARALARPARRDRGAWRRACMELAP